MTAFNQGPGVAPDNEVHDPAAEARSPDVLLTMRALLPTLSKAHRRIAEMILAEPQWALQTNINDLARRAAVAKPTVVRFARTVGCEGLKDFKLRLAGTLALGTPYLHRAVGTADTSVEVVNNVVGSTLSALAEWHRTIDATALSEAAKVLNRSRRVDCFGTGATSHFLAQDLQARLFRLGLNSTAYSDAYLQLVAATTLTSDDAAIAISFVGRMPALLESVTLAKSRGAKIIAISRRNTPLMRLADICLHVDVPADATMPVGTDAYVTQLMTIEILTIMLGRLRGSGCIGRLEAISSILRAKDRDTDTSSVVHWGWDGQNGT